MKNTKTKIPVLLFVALSAVGCSSGSPNSNADGMSANGQNISLSAEKLVGEYRDNAQESDVKYVGKEMSVAGKVNGIVAGSETVEWISLGGGMAKPGGNYMLMGVGCALEGDEKTRAKKLSLETDAPATLTGKNAGIKLKMGAQYVVLENCKLQ